MTFLCFIGIWNNCEELIRIRKMQEIGTLSLIVKESNDTIIKNKADSILQLRLKEL